MLRRWQGIRRLVGGIAAVVLVLAIAWVLFVPAADWLAHHDVGSAKGSLQTARDAARGRLLTLGAGLFAAGALVFTARNFTLSRRTFELTEQGQVTDRYTKAIEQLGSDKLDVRIGGIYALERVARDSARDHPTVMDVLAAFIREHSHEPWPPSDPAGRERARSTRPDVQAALTVVGRRDAKRDIERINLGGADLTRADLTGATSAREPHRRGPHPRAPHRRAPRRREPHRRGPHPREPHPRGPHRRAPRRRAPHRRAPHRRATSTRAPRDATSPARTSPARTSPARRRPHRRATSPARTSPARTSPARTSPARTSPARTSRRGPRRRGPHRRGPHRRQVAQRCASSGGLETRHRLRPTGESRHWLWTSRGELAFACSPAGLRIC